MKAIVAFTSITAVFGAGVADFAAPTDRAALSGLTQEPPPVSFEVASIRQAVTGQLLNDILSGNRRVALLVTDDRVSINRMSLAELLQRAFRIEPYRLFGPDWLKEVRFDIQATIPAGVNRDRMPEMLQALLAARFGLVMHRELRELPVFALVVGDDGPKLGAALPEPDNPLTNPGSNQNARGSAGAPPENGQPATGRGDFAITAKTETSTMTFKPGENGSIQSDISRMTMGELAALVTGFVGRPVVDLTKLAGSYHVTIEVAGAEVARMMNLGGGASGANTSRDAAPANVASEPPGQSSIVRSVQKLGLELKERRMPLEVIVVDKISRTATAN